jgi:hypothetical protein
MSTLRIVVNKLEPLLEEYSGQLREVEDGIRQRGIISPEICVKCSQKNILKVKKLGEEARKPVASFLAWIRENEIRGISSSGEGLAFRSTKKSIEGVEGSIPLYEMGTALGAATQKAVYEYRISNNKLKKKNFTLLLKNAFSSFRTCPHLSDLSEANYLALVSKTEQMLDFERRNSQKIEELWRQEPELISELARVLCKECYERIDSIGCEESIQRKGFVYVHGCPTHKIIFQNLLEKHAIKYVAGEERRFYESHSLELYLPDLRVLVSDTSGDLTPTIESLKPDSLLAFETKKDLPHLLQFGTNVILFDPAAEKNALIVFDKNSPVESSEERIIQKIISDLDRYSSEVRGKEHDKLVEAFRKIGEELGFVTQAEMAQKGARVDVVWLAKDGEAQVAIEVETSAQWKKDIVTTWETSPKLAVVLAHYKSDKGVQDIIQYNLLQYMPHRLLFISYLQKKAYLIEKQNIIGSYDIETAE